MNSSPTPAPRFNGQPKKADASKYFKDTPRQREAKKQQALKSLAWNKGIKLPSQQSGNPKPRGSQPQIIMSATPRKDTQIATASRSVEDAEDLDDFEDWEEVIIPGPSSEPATGFKTPSRPEQGQKPNQGAFTPETYQQFSSSPTSGPFSTEPLPSLLEKLEEGEEPEDEDEDDELDKELERMLDQELQREAVALISDVAAESIKQQARMDIQNAMAVTQQHRAAKNPTGEVASNSPSLNTTASHPKVERTTPNSGMGTASATSAMQVEGKPSMQERAQSTSEGIPSGPGSSSAVNPTFRRASSAQTGRGSWGTRGGERPVQATTTNTTPSLQDELKSLGYSLYPPKPKYVATETTAWTRPSAPDNQTPAQSSAPKPASQRAQIQAPKEALEEDKVRLQFQPQGPLSTASKALQQHQTTPSTPDIDVDMTTVAPPSNFSFNSAFSFSTTSGFSANTAPSSSTTTTVWKPRTQSTFAFKTAPSTSSTSTAIADSNTQNDIVIEEEAPSTASTAVANPNTQSNIVFKAEEPPAATTAITITQSNFPFKGTPFTTPQIANPTTQNSVTFNAAPSKPAVSGWNPITNTFAFDPAPSTSAPAVASTSTNLNPQISFIPQSVPAPPPRVLTQVERSHLWWDEMAKRLAVDEEKRLIERKAWEEAAMMMKAPARPAPFALVTGPEDILKANEVKGVRVSPSEIIPGRTASEYHKKVVVGEEAFDKRRNAGWSLKSSSSEAGISETKAEEWRRYNAMMDKKDEERKKRRFEESFGGARKRRYYVAGDDELEQSVIGSPHSLSPRVAHCQLYPADDVFVSPLPVSHPVHPVSLPVSTFEDQGDGWVNPEWLNEGQPKARRVIGLGRSLKTMASGILDVLRGKFRAIWEQAQTMGKIPTTAPLFDVSEQELTRLGLSHDQYHTLARKVCLDMGFQLPQGPVTILLDEDDDEEDGDYINVDDDDDTESSAGSLSASLFGDL